MHNMMVEVHIENIIIESEDSYKTETNIFTVDETASELMSNSHTDEHDTETVGDYAISNSQGNFLKYTSFPWQMRKLYSAKSSLCLQDTIKKHV